jgi:hypothetical protein
MFTYTILRLSAYSHSFNIFYFDFSQRIPIPDFVIKRLHTLGFEGPYSGGKHPLMLKGDLVLTILIKLKLEWSYYKEY